jgi:hypothetical protein
MPKPPIVIIKDLKTYHAAGVPDEFLEAIDKELSEDDAEHLAWLRQAAAEADEGHGTDVTFWPREQLIEWLMRQWTEY